MITKTLDGVIPFWVRKLVPQEMKKRYRSFSQPSYDALKALMCNFQVKNLVNVDPDSFKKKIEEFLSLQDYEMEGFKDPEKQRDLSVRFHWGHDHDFGEFSLKGRMGDRHISLIATFIDRFKAIPKSLDGLRVLDIGSWTGGTSLLLCAMGADVVSVEEVKKYVDCLNYMKHAFAIDRLDPRNLSLYECTTPEFQDAFDIVLFAGVLYHVSDPLLALRIAFNCTRDGGLCLVETAAIHSRRAILSYRGPSVYGGGTAKDLSRSGWDWFIPSPSTLSRLMYDVGFSEVQVTGVVGKRAFAVAKRRTHCGMMRGGLSLRAIK